MAVRVTLKDVAAAAGVHPSTVSRVLNSAAHHRMSPETVRRVTEAAEALNYRPSSVARALKTSRTFAVGVAVPDLGNPVFPPVVRGLEDILSVSGYTLIISNAESDLLQERTVVRAMLEREVDGVVLLTSHLRDPIVDELRAVGTPFVLIGRVVSDEMVPSVTSDDVAGMEMAVAHLTRLGHTRIAFVGGPQNVSTGAHRYQGFVTGHQKEGLTPISTLVEFAEAFDDVSGARACRRIIEWGDEFTALVASSDGIAMGCLEALMECDLGVPDDVSLVGFGGTRMGLHLRPTLTSVEVPYREMGRAGAELLLSQISGSATGDRMLFQPHLRIGGSTGPIQSIETR